MLLKIISKKYLDMIKVSNAALKQCRKILSQTQLDRFHFGLKSGGCVGFQYHFQPVDKIEPVDTLDTIVKIEDISFQICGKSQLYLIGTTIDWTTDVMEQKFVFDNPHSGSQCGCGTSF